jgi:cytochrome c oxidase assembly protein subunit 15
MREDRVIEQPGGFSGLLAVAFGTTVAMWIAGYLTRLPDAPAPGWVTAGLMLALMIAGGAAAGRLLGGWTRGALVGVLAALLNMLVLGSLLGADRPGAAVPSTVIWLPGALLSGALLGGLGAAFVRPRARQLGRRSAVAAFALVVAVATLAMVGIGGVVTSQEAGLAVPDWPNSYGYNMFLYPLARMTGGVYYEHAHRLFGTLVGLATMTLAVLLTAVDRRRGVRLAALAAAILVVVQGVLGGLRVTGRFTLSTSAADMAPSTTLAIVHGVLGQLFFALLVGLAVVTAPRWTSAERPLSSSAASADRTLGYGLLLVLVLQLVLGAIYRHTGEGLIVHISGAALVLVLAVAAGVRAWGLHGLGPATQRLLARLGQALLWAVGVQVVLGIIALSAVTVRGGAPAPTGWEVVLTTAHQLGGAVLLGVAVMLVLWTRRLLAPTPERRLRTSAAAG